MSLGWGRKGTLVENSWLTCELSGSDYSLQSWGEIEDGGGLVG